MISFRSIPVDFFKRQPSGITNDFHCIVCNISINIVSQVSSELFSNTKLMSCNKIFFVPVLLIRIRNWTGSDPHNFAGSCGIQGIRIRPIGIGFNSKQMKKLRKYNIFLENINMLCKILKIKTHLALMRKVKHCELAVVWQKLKKSSDFTKCVKLGVGRIRMRIGIVLMLFRIRILIWIGINMKIWFRIGIKTMPIHNTVYTIPVPYRIYSDT